MAVVIYIPVQLMAVVGSARPRATPSFTASHSQHMSALRWTSATGLWIFYC